LNELDILLFVQEFLGLLIKGMLLLLSNNTTSFPISSYLSATWDMIKPDPPVINNLSLFHGLSSFIIHGGPCPRDTLKITFRHHSPLSVSAGTGIILLILIDCLKIFL